MIHDGPSISEELGFLFNRLSTQALERNHTILTQTRMEMCAGWQQNAWLSQMQRERCQCGTTLAMKSRCGEMDLDAPNWSAERIIGYYWRSAFGTPHGYVWLGYGDRTGVGLNLQFSRQSHIEERMRPGDNKFASAFISYLAAREPRPSVDEDRARRYCEG